MREVPGSIPGLAQTFYISPTLPREYFDSLKGQNKVENSWLQVHPLALSKWTFQTFMDLLPFISGLTEHEASAFGRFLDILLGQANKWNLSKDLFEKVSSYCSIAIQLIRNAINIQDFFSKSVAKRHKILWTGKLSNN